MALKTSFNFFLDFRKNTFIFRGMHKILGYILTVYILKISDVVRHGPDHIPVHDLGNSSRPLERGDIPFSGLFLCSGYGCDPILSKGREGWRKINRFYDPKCSPFNVS